MRRAACFLFVALMAQAAAAQTILPDPAKSRSASKQVTLATSASAASAPAGSTITLYIDVSLLPGIHVYAPGAKDYEPISVVPTLVSGLAFAPTKYPKSETLKFAGDRVPVYTKPFRLTKDVGIALGAKSGAPYQLNAVVEYQACDDKVCFKPASVPVSWTITVR